MNLNLLFVEDNEALMKELVQYFDQEIIEDHKLLASGASSFQEGMKLIQEKDFDIVLLDLYNGEPSCDGEKLGLELLNKIQTLKFIPVIFYTGLTKDIEDLKSEVVGVVNKGDGIDQLKIEISRIINSNIALIKRKIHDHIEITLRDYFWKTIHKNKDIFDPIKNDVSIGYLLLRRLAHSLSKENIKSLLSDNKIKEGKAHPMEFYIFPTNPEEEYEVGEILSRGDQLFAILTPSCDFIKTDSRDRKVGEVLLAVTSLLSETPTFKNYIKDKAKNKDQISSLIESRKGDRYFFLPGTPFIDNLVLDFQNKIVVNYDALGGFKRIAKLDAPFAQSMVSSFIRYYNRIGYPDIDSSYVLEKL